MSDRDVLISRVRKAVESQEPMLTEDVSLLLDMVEGQIQIEYPDRAEVTFRVPAVRGSFCDVDVSIREGKLRISASGSIVIIPQASNQICVGAK